MRKSYVNVGQLLNILIPRHGPKNNFSCVLMELLSDFYH